MGAIAMNFASAKLVTPPTGTTGLSFTVTTGKGLLFSPPGPTQWFYGIFAKADKSAFEVVKITAVSGDTFTIGAGGRGLDGTTANTWTVNDIFYFGITRIYLNEMLAQTAFAATLLDDADAATARATLEVDSNFERNLLLNGSLQYWPEGTSFAAAASGTYPCENVQYRKSGAMVHTLARDSDVPSIVQAGYRIPYSLLATLTTADTSIAAGDFCVIEQFIEGYKWAPYWQRQLTLHLWVKMPLAGIYCVYVQNSIGDRTYVGEMTVVSTNTWERKKVTVSSSNASGTWDFTTGIGARVGICLAGGSTYQTTAGAWNTGAFLCTANQVNGCNTGLTSSRIADVRLSAGSTPEQMPMERYHDVEQEAWRYFQMVGGSGYNALFIPGAEAESANTMDFRLTFRRPMRAAPSVTFLGNGGGSVNAANSSNVGGAVTSVVAIEVYESGGEFLVTIAGSFWSFGQLGHVRFGNVAGSGMTLSARFT